MAKRVECLPMVQEVGFQSQDIIPKTQKMALDAALINILHYKVRIKGKVVQSMERISTLPSTSV